jgi:hypothetical protein
MSAAESGDAWAAALAGVACCAGACAPAERASVETQPATMSEWERKADRMRSSDVRVPKEDTKWRTDGLDDSNGWDQPAARRWQRTRIIPQMRAPWKCSRIGRPRTRTTPILNTYSAPRTFTSNRGADQPSNDEPPVHRQTDAGARTAGSAAPRIWMRKWPHERRRARDGASRRQRAVPSRPAYATRSTRAPLRDRRQ